MIYRTLRVDTLCTRSGSFWSTSYSLVYTQRQTTTSDRDNQIKSSLTEILGHYIDLPKIPQPIYQQLCDSTTVETGQNSPKIRINWPYLGLGCERWAPGRTSVRPRREAATMALWLCQGPSPLGLSPGLSRASYPRMGRQPQEDRTPHETRRTPSATPPATQAYRRVICFAVRARLRGADCTARH